MSGEAESEESEDAKTQEDDAPKRARAGVGQRGLRPSGARHRGRKPPHPGIQDFSDTSVTLSTASGALCVRGSGLSLCEVRENALIVRGAIRQVELPGEGDAR